ncbi:hypothetical protein ACLOJK_010827 [Asimina triloba]
MNPESLIHFSFPISPQLARLPPPPIVHCPRCQLPSAECLPASPPPSSQRRRRLASRHRLLLFSNGQLLRRLTSAADISPVASSQQTPPPPSAAAVLPANTAFSSSQLLPLPETQTTPADADPPPQHFPPASGQLSPSPTDGLTNSVVRALAFN